LGFFRTIVRWLEGKRCCPREERRETCKQDALRAWDDYQHTGLHLTAEEADAWLAKLEAGDDAEPPQCHG